MSNNEIQLVDEMEEWVVNIEARLDNPGLSRPTKPMIISIYGNSEELPSIYGNWQSWDDFGVSFLPETIKWKFVAYMNRWFGLDIRLYLDEIKKNEDLIWTYYEGVHEQFRAKNEKYFIEHLLVNSSFLIFAMVVLQNNLHLTEKLSGGAEGERFREFEYLSRFILRDHLGTQLYMLKMEYQIPWFVVDAIYTKFFNLREIFDTPIHKLVLLCFRDLYPRMHKSKVNDDTITLPKGGFKHLLHIFHWSRSPKKKFLVIDETLWVTKKMDSFYIPRATNLQLSETVFKKHIDGSIDVSYHEGILSGVLQLAPWHLFQYSTGLYESLLRFERKYEVCGYPFTAYVACMVCLLQTKADVRLLRANGIVPSTRNDENDILRYVQEFKTLLDDDVPMSGDLYDLAEKVRARHQRKSTRYYGEFKIRYCSNPWITMSVIAGILLFVLTFLQTLYGMLSYYKQ